MYLSKRFKIVELFDLVHNRNSLMLLANFFDLKFVRAPGHAQVLSKDLKYRTIVVKGDNEFVFHPIRIMSKHLILKKDISIDHYWHNAGLNRVSLCTYVVNDDHNICINIDFDINNGYTVEGLSLDQVAKLVELMGVIILKQIELGDFEEDDFD